MGGLVEVAGDQLRKSVEHSHDKSKESRLRVIALSQSQDNRVTKNVQADTHHGACVPSVFGIKIARCGMQADADQIFEFLLAKMSTKPDGSEPPVSAAIIYASAVATAKSRNAIPAPARITINQTPMPLATAAGLSGERCTPREQGAFAPPRMSSPDIPRSDVWSYPPWHGTGSASRDDHGMRI